MQLLFMLLFATFVAPTTATALRGETDVYACHDEPVTLRCDDFSTVNNLSTLAIYRAVFSTDGAFSSKRPHCSHEPVELNDTCSDDVRLVVNSRCSGKESCKFLVQDLVPRECYGDGMLRITYGCISATNVIKVCDVDVSGSTAEGFIQNPGYPDFYPDLKCNWTIRANQGQHVLVWVLDMSMKPTFGPMVDCRDYLQIYEGNVKVMHSCGQNTELLRRFESTSNVVRIIFSSYNVWPSRGVLIYYRVIGCATLPVPLHSYLVYRNNTMAHYMCCARHVFVDDFRRNRLLYCQEGNKWNGTVVPCYNVRTLRQWKNLSDVTFDEEASDAFNGAEITTPMQKTIEIVDILIPAMIMVIMVISNVIIVLVILRMRRMREKEEDKAELNGNQYKDVLEPQPSTSKEHGLDSMEPAVTRV